MQLTSSLIESIQKQEKSLTKTLIRWANINSGSYNLAGLKKMSDELMSHFENLGATFSRIPLFPLGRINARGELEEIPMSDLLKWEMRPKAPYRILLVGHYDTVFNTSHHFQTCDKVQNARLRGPGVLDMKGGILILHAALSILEKSAHKEEIGWTVMLNPDEEIGSISSSSHLIDAAQKHHIGFVFEPSLDESGTLAGVRKGSGNFHLACFGKAAHIGRAFHEGRNAVVAASALALEMNALNNQRPGLTINVSQIDGGGPTNVVPDTAVVRLGVRLENIEDQDWFIEQLESRLQLIGTSYDVNMNAHGSFTRPPKPWSEKLQKLFDWLAEQGHHLGLSLKWQATGGVCDGNNLSAAGLPTIDTLGARGGLIHSDQEFICLDSLSERIQLLTQCLLVLSTEKQERP